MLFLDSDVLPDENLVESLLATLETHSHWAGVEARVLPVDGEATVLWDAPVCESGGVYLTAAIAYRTELLRRAGGFDEQFLRAACEDVELAARILPFGEIGFAPNTCVRHPRRRKTFSMFWKKRHDWRYVLYLAQRHGFIGWPQNRTRWPRLRLLWCALVTQPAGRMVQSIRLARSAPAAGLLASGHAGFSWICGLAAASDILTATAPEVRNYVAVNEPETRAADQAA